MSILICGSLAYDIFLGYEGKFADVFGLNDERTLPQQLALPLGNILRTFGGNGGNIAWNLALLGDAPYLASAVGMDGGAYIRRLHSAGVICSHVATVWDIPTTTVIIATDKDGKDIAFFHAEASHRRTWDASMLPRDANIVHIAPSSPSLALSILHSARARGLRSVFDPGQEVTTYAAADLRTCLASATYTIFNQQECEYVATLLGEEIAENLCPALILTRGTAGSCLVTGNGRTEIAACRADGGRGTSIGAGDALRAGLLHALSREQTAENGLRLGSALASLTVEKIGAQLESVDEQELNRRMMEAYEHPLNLD